MAKFQKMYPIAKTPIVIDGETYQLRYNFSAFVKAEMELTKFWGKRTTIPGLLGLIFSSDNDNQLLSDRISINDLCILVWCGILHEYPKITLEEVTNFLELSDLADVMPIVLGAIGAAMTKPTPEDITTTKNDYTPQVPVQPITP
jgi:hypothetical protein